MDGKNLKSTTCIKSRIILIVNFFIAIEIFKELSQIYFCLSYLLSNSYLKKKWRKKNLNITVSKKSMIVIKRICLCSTNFIINCMHILCEALNSIHVYIYIWCTMYLLIIFFFLLFSSSIVSWMPVILSNQWLDLTCTYKLYILTYTYMHLHES